jgi:hypothetical protein
VFKYSTISTVMTHVARLYEDKGYAFVNVIPDTRTNADDQTVDLTFVVEKGEKVHIGRIQVTGNDPTFDKVVRRERVTQRCCRVAVGFKQAIQRLPRDKGCLFCVAHGFTHRTQRAMRARE